MEELLVVCMVDVRKDPEELAVDMLNRRRE